LTTEEDAYELGQVSLINHAIANINYMKKALSVQYNLHLH